MTLYIAMQALAELNERFTKLNEDLTKLAVSCISMREEYKYVYSAIASSFLQQYEPDKRKDKKD